MEISKHHDHRQTEDKWYKYWSDNGFFRSVPDHREPYTIVIPPPNVTGVLHMGHILNNTIQDVLVRRARMLGKNACWVPGTDHASIATEARVVRMLREKGIKKSDLPREDFLKYTLEWKEKHGGIILEQLKKLGASCDWERTSFTMDEGYYRDVLNVFVDLYGKGFIYRGLRMVNWDPVAKTTVSDEEVIFKQVNSKMVYVKYKYEDGSGHITIATVRPETIMGDVAVAVHPEDKRYKKLHGRKVIVPLVNRAVPVICDDAVDREFGTGCLKITPAHDLADYEIGLRHKLPAIDVLNEDGTISEAGKVFVGLDRFAARKKTIQKLQEDGLIEKMEDYLHQVGHSERTDAVIEPRLSLQWYLKMKEISKPALDAVMNGEVNLIPNKFINTYKYWMENVRDWCLSRQLWWGQRIPAWYCVCEECKDVVLVQKEKPGQCPKCNCTDTIKQDEDVLDTWFSSWLWPISVFDGFKNPDNADIKYYYPTNDLVTAPEILFFWVARMIMAGYEYRGEKPFSNVYLTGIVRDKQGRKMSKSLGNSPEPLDLIEKYGADGVRVGMLLCSPAGNDLLFDESYCEQGRNFSNKVWNAFRLIKGWTVNENLPQPEVNKIEIPLFKYRLNQTIGLLNNLFKDYKISDALLQVYKLFWDKFCASYLETIKSKFVDGKPLAIDKITYDETIKFFEELLKILHPFMPFITEEIWHLIKERKKRDCIIVSEWPQIENMDEFLNPKFDYPNSRYPKNPIQTTFAKIFSNFDRVEQGIQFIRKVRQQKNIRNKTTINVVCLAQYDEIPSVEIWKNKIQKLTNCKFSVNPQGGLAKTGYYFYAGGTMDWYVEKEAAKSISLDNLFGTTDLSEEEKIEMQDDARKQEIEELNKDFDYYKGFLASVQKKLTNEKFVQNAKPEIIEKERKKQADAEAKIKAIEEQLAELI